MQFFKNRLTNLALILVTILVSAVYFGAINKPNGNPANKPIALTSEVIQIISPTDNAYIPASTTFMAKLSSSSLSDYDMFWYVDNGSWNWMGNSNDYSSKQADLNVSGWTWHQPSNLYTISFVAVMHSNGQRVYGSVPIHVGNSPLGTTAPATTSTPTVTTTPSSATQTTPVLNIAKPPVTTTTVSPSLPLYVNPASNASQTAQTTTDPVTKRVMNKLAAAPTAAWFGGWNANVQDDANKLVTAASNANQIPVLVAYNIPGRDCGSYSAGGVSTIDGYKQWVQNIANGIGQRKAIIILEPDALAQITCLNSTDQASRYDMINWSVQTLKTNASTKVYIDAGNPTWVSASDMAYRLNKAGVLNADGFSLNVSNFIDTPSNINYGHQVSALTSGKHFVIDTSRNGNGSNNQWCNPSGRALGSLPTSQTNDSLTDYFLWVKTPGESDGNCNGGPNAGVWWPDYAQSLAINAGW